MTHNTIFQTAGSHLLVEELHDELVVFDRRTNTAHLIDCRAASIYGRARDGCSIDDLAAQMAGGTIEERRTLAQLGVAELERVGLVVNTGPALSRRGLLKSLAASVALPTVISIAAPTPSAAATLYAPCNSSADCGMLVCSTCYFIVPMVGVCQFCLSDDDVIPPGACPTSPCLCCSGTCDGNECN